VCASLGLLLVPVVAAAARLAVGTVRGRADDARVAQAVFARLAAEAEHETRWGGRPWRTEA
jgi:hypothetical protein